MHSMVLPGKVLLAAILVVLVGVLITPAQGEPRPQGVPILGQPTPLRVTGATLGGEQARFAQGGLQGKGGDATSRKVPHMRATDVLEASIGSGPPFNGPAAIAVEASGTLVVADAGLGAVMRVDPVTGDRTVMSGCTAKDPNTGQCIDAIGSGPAFIGMQDIAVEATGALVVVDTTGGVTRVLRVDSLTGDRTVVSGCTAADPITSACIGDVIGSGPPFVYLRAIAVEVAGFLAVVDLGLAAVLQVDSVSGDRTIMSDAGTGGGPPFVGPIAIATETDDSLLVLDFKAVLRLNPLAGDRTVVSGCTAVDPVSRTCSGDVIGSGGGFIYPQALAVEAASSGVVLDRRVVCTPFTCLPLEAAILQVNLANGDRALVSGGGLSINRIATKGRGPGFGIPTGIAVEGGGTLVVTDIFFCNGIGSISICGTGVLRVDPVSGDRTIVSQ